MKIREIRLQNGIFVYKAGISFTKWDFHLQRETLELQTGLSLYISPRKRQKMSVRKCLRRLRYISGERLIQKIEIFNCVGLSNMCYIDAR